MRWLDQGCQNGAKKGCEDRATLAKRMAAQRAIRWLHAKLAMAEPKAVTLTTNRLHDTLLLRNKPHTAESYVACRMILTEGRHSSQHEDVKGSPRLKGFFLKRSVGDATFAGNSDRCQGGDLQRYSRRWTVKRSAEPKAAAGSKIVTFRMHGMGCRVEAVDVPAATFKRRHPSLKCKRQSPDSHELQSIATDVQLLNV